MFMFNYGYSDSPAIVIALSIILAIGVIGLGYIIYEFFSEKSWQTAQSML